MLAIGGLTTLASFSSPHHMATYALFISGSFGSSLQRARRTYQVRVGHRWPNHGGFLLKSTWWTRFKWLHTFQRHAMLHCLSPAQQHWLRGDVLQLGTTPQANKAETLRRKLNTGWFLLWLVIALFFGTFTAA